MWRIGLERLVAVAVLVAASVAAGATPAAAQGIPTITVNWHGDGSDANISDGQCATADGYCSLRAAIENANALSGANRIEFDLQGSTPQTIKPASPLPPLYDADTIIDGYTQPGSRANTDEGKSNAVIKVAIEATNQTWGLRIESSGNTIQGLSVYGARTNIELFSDGADGNVIAGNFIGTNPAGTYTKVNVVNLDSGIELTHGPSQNRIGLPTLAGRNVVAGYGAQGIRVNGGPSNQNRIQNNIIGFNPSLTGSLGGWVGIDVQWGAWGNLVGGLGQYERNVVGNQTYRAGIDLSHGALNNAVVGNYVGVLADGSTTTDYSANKDGIVLKDGPFNNYIGHNVVGNSNNHGIRSYTRYNGPNIFDSNLVGVGVDGSNIGNTNVGIFQNGYDQLLYNNVVAYNGAAGIVSSNVNQGQQHHFTPDTTERSQIRQNTYYQNGGLNLDLEPIGVNINDNGDGDDGPNGLLNTPEITGMGPGKVFGTTCSGCAVEIYMSGLADANSSGLSPSVGPAPGVGAAWVGTATAGPDGTFSLASESISTGYTLSLLTVDSEGNTSELTPPVVVGSSHAGTNGAANASAGGIAPPAAPAPPPLWVSEEAVITGTVTDADGNPATGAQAELFTQNNDGSRGDWVASASVLSGSGTYRIEAPAGCWVVTFVAPSGQTFAGSGTPWLSKPICTTAGESVTNFNATLASDVDDDGAITGTVTKASAAVNGVLVDLFEAAADGSRGQWVASATTNANGKYNLPTTDGCWILTFVAAEGETFTESPSRYLNRAVCTGSGETVSGIDAALVDATQAATINGIVTDSGNGVGGVQVDLFTAAENGSRANWVSTSATSGDGSFVLAANEGCWVLTYVAPADNTFAASGSRWLNVPVCTTEGQTATVDAVVLS